MPPTPFRRSLPITLTSFINKSGSIGLSIVPIILVERHISNEHSAWIIAAIRVASLAGILLGGWSSDQLGLKKTLLLSFTICGIGLAPLPYSESAMALAAFACLAQLGTSLYLASARLLITQVVAKEDRREAIAWQRTANNLAQIISFSLGALLSGFGTTLLILFDAVTSFIAAGVGARILPNPRPNLSANPSASLGASSIPNPSANLGTNPPLTEIAQPPASPDLDTMAQPLGDSTKTKSRRDFYHCALVIASFSFLYDLYEVGGAARCKIIFGQEGLAVFSEVMVINTALCAALSVVAAKKMQNAANALPIGMFLLIAGLVITFMGNQGRAVFFAGSFVMTAGEITFNSLAAVVLIHLTPQSKRQGATYSTGVFVQSLGRILGSALAFPMLIGSDHALAYVFVASIPTLGICLSARPLLKRLEAW